ncbi:MAG: cytochrome c biogenesis protein CcsA [Abitibacteriaceae bacterium]|nr:cytochrome c biogenesis protein CcsA [Abditibacteriaceae bacterium]MBV9866615.1 cytochrome c biogenesis protein CcsA [Abditibacteriaceae bacterium]
MNTSWLSRYESLLLLGAVVAYLASMLLLWSQLFLQPDKPSTDVALESGQAGHHSAAITGRIVLGLGALLHFLALVGQGHALFTVQAGVAGLFGWILAIAYLLVGQRLGRRTLGVFVTPVALIAAIYSFTAPLLHNAAPRALHLEQSWLLIHVFIILISYVALAFAFAASLIYLIQEGLLKRKRLSGLWQRLPSLQVADDLIYRTTSFGLAMLTLGILTGIMWQQMHQQQYAVLQDPKVIFSLVTWVTFAIYMGARQGLGWRGRRTNLVVVCGFLLLVISFFGAPHLLNGVAR